MKARTHEQAPAVLAIAADAAATGPDNTPSPSVTVRRRAPGPGCRAMIADEDAAEQVPMELWALTAEHSSLQTARSSTIFETGVRATLFLGAVSSGLIALAFLGQLSAESRAFHLFALVLLPALVLLGILTHLRLVELAVEDVFYGRAINRIRHYYLDVAPHSRHYFLLSASDDLAGVATNTGRPHSRWHFLSHAATTTLLVTSALAGTSDALALHLAAPAPLPASAGLGVGTAIAVAASLLAHQCRAWERGDEQTTTIFPSPQRPPIDHRLLDSQRRPGQQTQTAGFATLAPQRREDAAPLAERHVGDPPPPGQPSPGTDLLRAPEAVECKAARAAGTSGWSCHELRDRS